MPDVKGGVVTPLSNLVLRVVQGARATIRGVGTGNWFGPLQPLQPVAPPEVKGRRYDYAFGSNLNYIPRATEFVSFEDLRALSYNLPILRTVIETRKDQVASLGWMIKPRGVNAKSFSSKDALKDQRISKLQDFFQFPDRQNPFDTWLRLLLEELFVTDAVTIEPRRTRGGDLYSLDLIDGKNIKPLIGEDGRPPLPPDPAYEQVLKGVVAANFSRDELLYLPRNRRIDRLYGYPPVEQVILTINTALRRDVHALGYYTEGTLPEAFGNLPKEWSTEQVRQFQAYFDNLLTDNLADRRKLRFMPGDFKFQEVRQPPLKDLYDEWIARVICYAFSVPPTPFVHMVNRATADSMQQQAQMEGLVPIQNYLKALFDLAIGRYWGAPDLEFAWDDSWTIKPLERAQADQIDVVTRIRTINEVRDERGLPPLDDPQANGVPPPSALGVADAKNSQEGDDSAPPMGDDAEKLMKYSPNQARDYHGRFSSQGGAAGAVRGRRRKPKEVAGAKWDATTPAGVRLEAGVKIAKAAALGTAAFYASKAVARMRAGGWRTAAGFVVSTMVGTSIHWGLSSVHALLEQAADALGVPREHADKAIEHMRQHVYTIVDAFIAPSIYKAAGSDVEAVRLLEYVQTHGDAVLAPSAEAFKRDVRAKAGGRLSPEQYVIVDKTIDDARKAVLEAASQALHDLRSGAAEKLAKAQEEWPAGKAPKPKHLRNLRGLWQDIFAGEARKAAAAFLAAHPDAEKLAKVDPDTDVDFAGHEADVAEAVAEAAADGGGAGLNELFDRMATPASGELRTAVFERANARAHAWARKRAADLVSGVEDTTRRLIRRTIADGLAEGKSIADIASDIQDSTAFSDERADLIAQTEVSNANSYGALEGYQAAKDEGLMVKKKWVVAVGACPLCQENAEAGPIALDAEFPNGVMAPVQHPRCRCVLEAVVDGQEES